MALPKWNDIPVAYRRSLKKYHEYLRSLENSDDDDDVDPTTRDISVTVKSGETPIENASVTIGSTTRTTGSAGGCSFTGIAEGETTVTVTAEGYTEKTETITVDSTHTSFEISLVAVDEGEQ